jgi:DNA recombination protein RmuC
VWKYNSQKTNLKENLDLQNNLNQQTEKLQEILYKNQTGQLNFLNEQSLKAKDISTQEFLRIQEKLAQSQLDIQSQIQKNLQILTQNVIEISRTELAKIQDNTSKQLEILEKSTKSKLDEINTGVQKRLDENFARNLKSFQEVSKNLGQMEQKAVQMIESTKSIDKLNNIFSRTSSKAFGGFAENYLESLLHENLAKDSWQKQVKIPNSSEILDFVITLENKKIGIDAKFPLTKYQDYIQAAGETRDSKKKEFLQAVMQMAKEISEKYYKNNFVDALLLYLPSESLYNEVLDTEKNQQVAEYLVKLKVSLTSPNTILPQLLLIRAYQFKLQISNNAENIVKGLRNIRKNIDSFKDEYRKLGEKIRQAQQNYDLAERNLIGVEKNILLLETEDQEKLI